MSRVLNLSLKTPPKQTKGETRDMLDFSKHVGSGLLSEGVETQIAHNSGYLQYCILMLVL